MCRVKAQGHRLLWNKAPIIIIQIPHFELKIIFAKMYVTYPWAFIKYITWNLEPRGKSPMP